jgi:hypothetical protein
MSKEEFKAIFVFHIFLMIFYGFFLFNLGYQGIFWFNEIPFWLNIVGLVYITSLIFLIILIYFGKGLELAKKNIFVNGFILVGFMLNLHLILTNTENLMPLINYGFSILSFFGIITAFIIIRRKNEKK